MYMHVSCDRAAAAEAHSQAERADADSRPASIMRTVVTAGVAFEPATAHSTALGKDAAMGQAGHACMASAETSRNSFAVAPLAD